MLVYQAASTTFMAGWWFQPSPLKNMTSSVGSMKFPIYGKSGKS